MFKRRHVRCNRRFSGAAVKLQSVEPLILDLIEPGVFQNVLQPHPRPTRVRRNDKDRVQGFVRRIQSGCPCAIGVELLRVYCAAAVTRRCDREPSAHRAHLEGVRRGIDDVILCPLRNACRRGASRIRAIREPDLIPVHQTMGGLDKHAGTRRDYHTDRRSLVSPIVGLRRSAVLDDHLGHHGAAQPASELIGRGSQSGKHDPGIRGLCHARSRGFDLRSPTSGIERKQLRGGKTRTARGGTRTDAIAELHCSYAVGRERLHEADNRELHTAVRPSGLHISLPGSDWRAARNIRGRVAGNLALREPARYRQRPIGLRRPRRLVDGHRIVQGGRWKSGP